MAIDVDDLRTEVNASTNDDDRLSSCVTIADALLTGYVGGDKAAIPTDVYDLAWLNVARDVFNQRQAPNGVLTVQTQGVDGQTLNVPLPGGGDPLRSAYSLLAPWVAPVTFA